jgi:hypothetical protein
MPFMARAQNALPSVKITVSTTPTIRDYLSALVSTGLYGKNPADAAERLLAKGIEQAISAGTIMKQLGRKSSR